MIPVIPARTPLVLTKGKNIPQSAVPKNGAPKFVVVMNKMPNSVSCFRDTMIETEMVIKPTVAMMMRDKPTSEMFRPVAHFCTRGRKTKADPDRNAEKELNVAEYTATMKIPVNPEIWECGGR